MSFEALIAEIEKLSDEEQSRLLDEILLMQHRRHPELTPAQHADFRRRIEEADANPHEGRPWEEVREDLRRRFG
jgi:putative addiction module component (TIGR02574 family)